jgi:hypothetical protein
VVFLNKRLDKDFILPLSELSARRKLEKILKSIEKPKIIKKPRSKLSVK